MVREHLFVLFATGFINGIPGKQLGFFPIGVIALSLLPLFLVTLFRLAGSSPSAIDSNNNSFASKGIALWQRAIAELFQFLVTIVERSLANAFTDGSDSLLRNLSPYVA